MLVCFRVCMRVWLFALLASSILLFGCTQYGQTSKTDENGYITCGGIAGIKCPEGYVCIEKEKGPDSAGYCMPQYVDYPRDENGTMIIPSPSPEPR